MSYRPGFSEAIFRHPKPSNSKKTTPSAETAPSETDPATSFLGGDPIKSGEGDAKTRPLVYWTARQYAWGRMVTLLQYLLAFWIGFSVALTVCLVIRTTGGLTLI